jgi:hypothetical protein
VAIVAVVEHGGIDRVRRCRVIPDPGIDALEVDPRITPRLGE